MMNTAVDGNLCSSSVMPTPAAICSLLKILKVVSQCIQPSYSGHPAVSRGCLTEGPLKRRARSGSFGASLLGASHLCPLGVQQFSRTGHAAPVLVLRVVKPLPMASSRKLPQIEVQELTDDKIVFKLTNCDTSLANALRRVLISEVSSSGAETIVALCRA